MNIMAHVSNSTQIRLQPTIVGQQRASPAELALQVRYTGLNFTTCLVDQLSARSLGCGQFALAATQIGPLGTVMLNRLQHVL